MYSAKTREVAIKDSSPAVAAPAHGAPSLPDGLSGEEAARRLAQAGANELPEKKVHPALRVLRHFWSPVPWMLEVTVILQVSAGERLEAILVAALLLINVAAGMVQEGHANATLALLRQRLAPRVRVRRDGVWQDLPAAQLVVGDIVQLTMGCIVPADVRLVSGRVLLDQSMITGESLAVEKTSGAVAYASALVRRGEAVAEVVATGVRTYFGRTAELVRRANVESSEQAAVLGVVKTLTIVNLGIVVGIVSYARAIDMGMTQIIPLVLAALLSAVPIAMPTVFTLAATLGARRLAHQGVLLTRLSALQEAAMIDVLCVDKTGTLTENSLGIGQVVPLRENIAASRVLALAAAASSATGQDPVDMAVRRAAQKAGAEVPAARHFSPFDPATKMAKAIVDDDHGQAIEIAKGSPIAISGLAPLSAADREALRRLSEQGYRVLAVAAGARGRMRVEGLLGLADPPREDSAPLLAQLRGLGITPVMVTGDTPETAAAIARAIGLDGPICPPGNISALARPEDHAVFAGVFPEDKFALVQALQREGHAVGMCGDGANDAPALRQSHMGIAVASATDIAKSAAGLVLTQPGLRGIVGCIEEGRAAFRRVFTFTLSIMVNKAVTLVVMGGALMMTHQAVLTPMLQVLWMLTSDIAMLARAGDRAAPTPYPNAWRIPELTLAAVPLGAVKLTYAMAILAAGWYWLHFDVDRMRTLTFLTLVLAGQATSLVLRENVRVWHTRPAPVLLAAMAAAAATATLFVWRGWLMAPLSVWMILAVYGANMIFGFVLDATKIWVMRRLPVDRRPSAAAAQSKRPKPESGPF